MALWIAAELKKANLSVEYVDEKVKQMAYEGVHPKGFDQAHLLTCQMKREERYLINGVNHIVTDCPAAMGFAYAVKQNSPGLRGIRALIEEFEEVYPSLNIFLDREGVPYTERGRYQNYQEALEMDGRIRGLMNEMYGSDGYAVLPVRDDRRILDFILSRL